MLTDEQWDRIASLIEHGFRHPADDPWNDDREDEYRSTLGAAYSAEVLAAGLAKLLHTGRGFRPEIPEITAAIEHDPGLPASWGEVEQLLFGLPGARGRGIVTVSVAPHPDQPTYQANVRAAVAERLAASDAHPAIVAFVQPRVAALRAVDLDGEWAAAERRRLDREWTVHLDSWKDQTRHTRALGMRAPAELRRLEPLAALGEPRRAAIATASGDGS